MAKKNNAQLAHYIYYHEPDKNKRDQLYAGILWYYVGLNGACLTRHGEDPSRKLTPTGSGPVTPGNYLHFKGNVYYAIDCLELQETGVFYVIYFLQKPGETIKWYYREANEFTEMVQVGRRKKPRFRKI